jgi:hypothetical protein|tara:strand:- start:289 stop:621 length:333 start_codon:yes stop_codon:yes gene_type:complete
MKIWILHGVYEGELFCSSHITEKGAALAAIADVLEFLGVEDEEDALSVANNLNAYSETDGEQSEAIEWDQEKMSKMSRDQLWKIFREWTQLTWDNSLGYQIDIDPVMIQA